MRAMEGQSVFDVAIIGCGTAEAALSLAIKNALSITAELSPGQHLDVVSMTNADTAAYFSNRGLVVATALGELAHHPAPPVVVSVIGSTMFVGDAVTAMDNQSLFDIAVERLGSADAALMLAVKNGLSITDQPNAGQKLQPIDVANADIAGYFSARGIKPCTGATTNYGGGELAPEGIGYWAIGIDFVIS